MPPRADPPPRSGPPPPSRPIIGVSGHRTRPGIDWTWTGQEIRRVLVDALPIPRAYSSLAAGADQLFAHHVLALGIPLTAIIPMPHYEQSFTPAEHTAYRALLARCHVVQLQTPGSDEQAYLAAGQHVARSCNLLVAVWDGEPAAGLGGTADIVAYCRTIARPVIHLDPIRRTVQIIRTPGKSPLPSREGSEVDDPSRTPRRMRARRE